MFEVGVWRGAACGRMGEEGLLGNGRGRGAMWEGGEGGRLWVGGEGVGERGEVVDMGRGKGNAGGGRGAEGWKKGGWVMK